MILIGLSDCPGCKLFKQKHPELRYIELPRKVDPKDKDMMNLKKTLGRLGITSFPVILNMGMTRTIPLKMVDPEWPEDEG